VKAGNLKERVKAGLTAIDDRRSPFSSDFAVFNRAKKLVFGRVAGVSGGLCEIFHKFGLLDGTPF
jgi:hypothetical protein